MRKEIIFSRSFKGSVCEKNDRGITRDPQRYDPPPKDKTAPTYRFVSPRFLSKV
jgi:hypothetical protein